MILVLAGTAEGREVVSRLSRAGYPVTACAATEYGGQLLAGTDAREVITGRLDAGALADIIRSRGIQLVVDATHPFAELATANAKRACADTGVFYLRFQRSPLPLPDSPLVHPVPGYDRAATRAVELPGRVIFLSTGTRTLPVFTAAARRAGKKVVARILPDVESLNQCLALGIAPREIVAIQGPFSAELNKQLLLHYRADVLVTKESGITGGVDAKLEAALALSIPVVVVTRPPVPEGAVDNAEELLARILAVYDDH